jgi:hypothetical protein
MKLKQGDRVVFIEPWEIFSSDVLIKAGETGTYIGRDDCLLLGVRMDRHIPNLSEWENVVWLDTEVRPFDEVIRTA